MPWEAGDLSAGTTVYVDDDPYTVTGVRYRVGQSLCPPYVGLVGHDCGPVEGPRLPLKVEHDEGSLHGSPIWWVSYLRVRWDAPALDPQVEHPGQQRVWRKARTTTGG